MSKINIFLLLLFVAALAGFYMFFSETNVVLEEPLLQSLVHYYGKPETPLAQIKIKAFYFVPKNKKELIAENWYSIIEGGFEELKQFHELQFQGRSQITYDIHPNAVIGLENSDFYDGNNTTRGNPNALIRVAEEIEQRMLKKEDNFTNTAYSAMFILYEGVGAAGGVVQSIRVESKEDIVAELDGLEENIFKAKIDLADGIFLINRDYLSGKKPPFGSTVLVHEFYHTLGVPDHYDLYNAKPFSLDIMGLGINYPLMFNYLDNEVLENMGI